MKKLLAVEPVPHGAYLRFSNVTVRSQHTLVGGIIVIDFDSHGSVIGIHAMRLGSIELQALADVARTYYLNFDLLLGDSSTHTARAAPPSVVEDLDTTLAVGTSLMWPSQTSSNVDVVIGDFDADACR